MAYAVCLHFQPSSQEQAGRETHAYAMLAAFSTKDGITTYHLLTLLRRHLCHTPPPPRTLRCRFMPSHSLLYRHAQNQPAFGRMAYRLPHLQRAARRTSLHFWRFVTTFCGWFFPTRTTATQYAAPFAHALNGAALYGKTFRHLVHL